MSRFVSEILGKHDRTGFGSGNDRIDAYFRTVVSQDVKRGYGLCFVLVEKDTGTLAGFYSLVPHSMQLTELPPDLARKLPRYPTVPTVLIGWLGRDTRFTGQNIGALLLADAIARVRASDVRGYALVADAIDEAAASFYRKHGFIPFAGKPASLFLPMATAAILPS